MSNIARYRLGRGFNSGFNNGGAKCASGAPIHITMIPLTRDHIITGVQSFIGTLDFQVNCLLRN